MLARYSGQAGLCAIGSGLTVRVAVIGQADSASVYVDSRLLGRVFDGCSDETNAEFLNEDAAQNASLAAWAANVALRLFLMVLENSDPPAESREVAVDIEKLILDHRLKDEVIENEMYSHSLPETLAVVAITDILQGLDRTSAIFQHLLTSQVAISKVRLAFDALPATMFEDNQRFDFLEAAIKTGCFRQLVLSIQNEKNSNLAILHALKSLDSFNNFREIVSVWTEAFKAQTLRPRHVISEDGFHERDARDDGFHERDARDAGFDGAAGRQEYENAISQQAAVIEKMKLGNLPSARQFCSALIKQQLNQNRLEYAAKSLCRLSQEAKRLQIFELELEWAAEAAQIAPMDHRTHGQFADALIHVSRFAQAMEELNRTEEAGDAAFAATGRARVLRAQGKLVEARRSYLACKENALNKADLVHATAGAAGVLREMGHLEQSRAEYEAGLAQHPGQPILITGLAATFTEMGLFTDAAAKYHDASIGADAVVALNGRANIFKLAGKLDEAEAQYREIMRRFPFDPSSRCGLADVLRLKGLSDEALTIYKEVQQRFPYRAIPFTGAALIYRDRGDFDAAVTQLKESADRFPGDTNTITALASVFKKQGRLVEALEQINKALAIEPESFNVKLAKADVLRRLGEDNDAFDEYDRILLINSRNRQAINAKASLLIKKNLLYEADQLLGIGKRQTEDDWHLFSLRAIIAMRLHDFNLAETQLKWGIARVPFARERKLLSTMLASVYLAQHKPQSALPLVEAASLDSSALVYLHVYAANDNFVAAKAIYAQIGGIPARFVELREEIAKRFKVIDGRPSRSLRWVFQNEQDVLLLDAAA